jgi:hypothetical protein
MAMISPTAIMPAALPSVPLDERGDLPMHAGIYFMLAGDTVLYIGRAGSLYRRWRVHHRLKQFNAHGTCRIAWLYVDDPSLPGAGITREVAEHDGTHVSRLYERIQFALGWFSQVLTRAPLGRGRS